MHLTTQHRVSSLDPMTTSVGFLDSAVLGLSSSAPQPAKLANCSIIVKGVNRQIEVKYASDLDDFKGAFELVASKYLARGYEAPSDKRYRFTPFHMLPTTSTFVAKTGGRVVATLSLVPDTKLFGLPMESVYGEEVADLRGQRRHIAEATSLAEDGLGTREFILVFTAMIKLAIQTHLMGNGNTWVITIHPRHRNFYRNVLGFESLGGIRSYPSVQNNPAEAFVLDMERMKRNAPKMHAEIMGEWLPDATLTAPEWSSERVRYFAERSTQSTPKQLKDVLEWIELFGSAPRWNDDQELHDAQWSYCDPYPVMESAA